jgi:hypothetical protein
MPKGVYKRSEETKQQLAKRGAAISASRKGKKAPPKSQCSKGHPLVEDNIKMEGSRVRCRTCCASYSRNWDLNNKEKRRERSRKWSKENPDKTRANRRKKVLKQYDLTVEMVELILKEQGNKCGNPGCPVTEPGGRHNTWHVDHNHVTGKARGLLCNTCNVGLGMLGENENRILGLIEYLRMYKENKCLDVDNGLYLG